MKKSTWILTLLFFLTISIYASPANNTLEFVATFCHFADTGITCTCPEEAKENRNEQEKLARKMRRDFPYIGIKNKNCSCHKKPFHPPQGS